MFDSSLILAKFAHALVKSRPLKETGAEQVNQTVGGGRRDSHSDS